MLIEGPPELNDNTPDPPVIPVPEMRISPDRTTVVVRTDEAEDSWKAWGYINKFHGGGWMTSADVEGWDAVYPRQT